MTTTELTQYFEEEGYNPANYSINTRGSDVFCLMNDGQQWSVFYTERGRDESPVFTSSNESEACQFYVSLVQKMRQDHCVGFFKSKQAADDLQEFLKQQCIEIIVNKIPYGGPNDPRYRVFVVGKDIFAARRLLGELPLEDAGK